LGGESLARGASACAGCHGHQLNMQEVNFDEALELIIRTDNRYHRDAYHFVRHALDRTKKIFVRTQCGERSHVSGPELLEGIRQLALEEFGPMVITVFAEWGVHRGEDFGEIVFNMVETGLLGKTEKESRADFAGGYTFEEAFRKPFLPSIHLKSPSPEPKVN
jgi:uncharacterized repeat protein (TIGR04138 family)